MTHAADARRLTRTDMAKRIRGPTVKRFHIGLTRGQLQIELYIAEKKDLQKPPSRDECYVVLAGGGRFHMDEKIVPFGLGDVLFCQRGWSIASSTTGNLAARSLMQ